MRVDIFIPTSDRADSLKNCIDSINNQTSKNFNVFLVGLKKDKAIEKLVGDFKNLNINYFIQKKKGIIGAANEALEKANGDIFVCLDDDVVLDKDWFLNLIETYQADKKIGGVTGPTLINQKGMAARDLTFFLSSFKKSKNPFLKFLSFIYD